MNCPSCRQALIVLEREEIELDYCPRCRGLWFDAGELALLYEKIGVEAALPPLGTVPAAPTAERKRPCPRCRRRMKKKRLGKEGKAVVDVCPVEDGLWFDAGELALVVQRHREDQGAGDRLAEFLGETLGGQAPPPAEAPA